MTDVLRPLLGGRLATVEREGPLETPCVLWQGAINSKGYAVRGTKEERFLVHRRVFEDERGPIPEGHEIHHLCEVRRCVNVAHLQAVRPLAHRRVHLGRLIDLIFEELRTGEKTRREFGWIALDAGFSPIAINNDLHRLTARGEIVRVRRGVYALPESRAREPEAVSPTEGKAS